MVVIKPVWRDYLELCKPKVVALMLLTALVGMHLATTSTVPASIVFYALLGIACAASSAAAINHVADKHIDTLMRRTEHRPIATGKISTNKALVFAFILAIIAMYVLCKYINVLTAVLSLITLIAYAFFYTLFLKRATPQNIVIGGIAGAAPPLLGWTAVTGHISAYSLLPVLIIFAWTPPHFWALSIYRYKDYVNAKIPMLPVTHGIRFTKLCILLYTLLLLAVSLLPFVCKMNGWLYFSAAMILGLRFLYWAVKLILTDDNEVAIKTFRFSITYLMVLFIVMLLDHYL